jgi:hypothetical protein
MSKPTFSLVKHRDPAMIELIRTLDQRLLAVWALACTARVMPFFEKSIPQDPRPRWAIVTLQNWIISGEFKMAVIRRASLDSHAAARDVGEDNPARSAAHAAGQAVATAHVSTHSYGAALYALQAVHRASAPSEAEAAVEKEHLWQSRHLQELILNPAKFIQPPKPPASPG